MRAKTWGRKAAIGLSLVAVLVAAAVAYASGGGEAGGHGGGYPPEKWWDLLWRTLNFAALLLILIKYLKKPIANGLASRRESIRQQFTDLESQKAAAERTYREYEQKLTAIEQEVTAIIDGAVKQGEAEKARIIEEGTRAAADLKRQAEMAIQQELAAAIRRLREEVAEGAVEMAEAMIRDKIKAEDQMRLLESCLERAASQDYQKGMGRIQ
ncbi:MAG: F0F1 ATP synthase subunit B [Thermodesulfobacteriota bacterium]